MSTEASVAAPIYRHMWVPGTEGHVVAGPMDGPTVTCRHDELACRVEGTEGGRVVRVECTGCRRYVALPEAVLGAAHDAAREAALNDLIRSAFTPGVNDTATATDPAQG